jgi:hypothetical protein
VEAAFQLSVGVRETPVDALAGETRDGGGGAAMIVVNENPVEYALVPPALVALTRQ